MPREILLPELAESVVEGEIQRWLVAVGDQVAADQPIVEVMTDKATVELPSPFAGVVYRLLAKEGDVVRVHAPIAVLLEAGEAEPVATPPAAVRPPDASLFTPSADTSVVRNPFLEAKRIRATPRARKAARDQGVDLGGIAGSGPHGRIRLGDVEAAAAQPPTSAGSPGSLRPLGYQSPAGYEHLEERIPLKGLRRVISEQMTLSHLHPVRTLVVDEADVTGLKEHRARLNRAEGPDGPRLTYLPFICQALSAALETYPLLNASLDEATGEMVLKRYCNLGIAVAAEAGPVVPVIRDVGPKSLTTLAREIEDLAARARHGKLTPLEVTGSTFTITSIGNVGTLFTFPIIHLPNVAILGVHTIKRRAVVVEVDGAEQIVPRDMIYLSLSFDHRLIDGATAAHFLRDVIGTLEGSGKGEAGRGTADEGNRG